jgi:hypothetical protein
MPQNPQVDQLHIDLDQIVEKYSECDDPEVYKILRRITRIRKRFDPSEALDMVAKILSVADKIGDLVDRLPPLG